MKQPEAPEESSQKKPVIAEWITSFLAKIEVDAELVYGTKHQDLFQAALQKAREKMPDRQADINYVTFHLRNTCFLGNGRCSVDLQVCAFQRF